MMATPTTTTTRVKLAFGPDVRQAVDLFLPAAVSPSHAVPLLVFVHGGAWVSEATEGFFDLAEYLAGRAGVAVALPEYRLTTYKDDAPPNTVWHPDHMQDVFRGLETVFDEGTARKYGYETQDAVLVGHSAGGYMTLAVALDSAHPSVSNDVIRQCPPLDDGIRKSIKAFVCVESIFSLVAMLKHYRTYDYFTTPAFYPPRYTVAKQPYDELAMAGPESWPLHASGTYYGAPGDKPDVYVIHSRKDTLLDCDYARGGVDLLQSKGIDVHVDMDTFDDNHDDILHTLRFWDRLVSVVRE